MEMRVSSRSRRVSLLVKPGGKVILTRPIWASEQYAQQFALSKSAWLARAVARMQRVTVRLELPRTHYKKQRVAAKRFVQSRIRELNQEYGFIFNKIFIKNQKTRWGSCSHQKNLSFNYRIVSLPPELADYLIVHELCHTQELNHSKRFWALVTRVIPNPKQARAALQRYTITQ